LRSLFVVLLSLVIGCSGTKKRTPRPLVESNIPFEEFVVGDYNVKAYENKNYAAEDWLYRFICQKSDGAKREFALRTKIIQSRQFYLSEKLSGGWESVSYFDARPTYQVVKLRLIEILTRPVGLQDSAKQEKK